MKTVLGELLRDVAPRAVIDVFHAYDVKLQNRQDSVPVLSQVPRTSGNGAIVAGVVGFSGSDIRGTSLLATTFELAALVRPASMRKTKLSSDSASDWIFVRDWVGELCNQAIGRIKNKVQRYGVGFDVGPPTAFSGSALVFALPKSPAAYRFAFGFGAYTVWFSLEAIFDMQRQVVAGPEDSVMGEGKVVMFD
jgi:CheY-specific phosphatase CheX